MSRIEDKQQIFFCEYKTKNKTIFLFFFCFSFSSISQQPKGCKKNINQVKNRRKKNIYEIAINYELIQHLTSHVSSHKNSILVFDSDYRCTSDIWVPKQTKQVKNNFFLHKIYVVKDNKPNPTCKASLVTMVKCRVSLGSSLL